MRTAATVIRRSVKRLYVREVGNPRPTVEASRSVIARRTARATLEQRGVRCGDTIDCGVCHMAPFRDRDGKTLMLHHPRR